MYIQDISELLKFSEVMTTPTSRFPLERLRDHAMARLVCDHQDIKAHCFDQVSRHV